MSRLEAKGGATPFSALIDAELDAEISWRRAALAAEAERIAALPEHLRPVPTAEDEAVTRRIAELEAGLADPCDWSGDCICGCRKTAEVESGVASAGVAETANASPGAS